MSIAKVTEISATSTKSFDDATREGIDRASRTIRNMKSAWVKDQHVKIEDGKISTFRVNLAITFLLED
ncbi:dodecin family protein [Marivita sp. S2033]|uniref:dodecin family protein n=1 Tax=Marivita sp. S2033 TaxID=3373187 RepID=UPI003981BED2